MNLNIFNDFAAFEAGDNENLYKILQEFQRLSIQAQNLNFSHRNYDFTQQDNIKKGLDAKTIKMIKKMKIGKSKQCCSICANLFAKDEVIRKLPCKHIFHDDCVIPWLKVNEICPYCRLNVKEYFIKNKK